MIASVWDRFLNAARRPVDGASLAVVRVATGVVGAVTAVRLLAHGWAWTRISDPPQRLAYWGLEWVPRPSHHQMTALVVVMGLAAAALAVGVAYRWSAAAFAVSFAWIESIEATTYLNHYWFVVLVATLLVVAPGDACWTPRRPDTTIAVGWLWLVRAQVGVVYVFAGVAKLTSDWLVHGLPLRFWLPGRTHLPVIRDWFAEPWFAVALSVAGAAFDLTVVPLLAFRPTRPYAFGALVAFHAATGWLFPIGVFPWLMVAAGTVWFAPSWPRRVVRRPLHRHLPPRPLPASLVAAGLVWVVVQCLVPLRHWLVPGDHRWTREGARYAWAVLADERAGDVVFHLFDPQTGERWDDTARGLLTRDQWSAMATEPDLIHQTALLLASRARQEGHAQVQVTVDAWVSFNGRPPTPLIDPAVDLARESRRVWHRDWLLPGPLGPPP